MELRKRKGDTEGLRDNHRGIVNRDDSTGRGDISGHRGGVRNGDRDMA